MTCYKLMTVNESLVLQTLIAINPFNTVYTHTHTHTHTHPFNGPFSGTTQVSRYQKGKTNLDFTGARDSEWQWHQLGHMQVCSSVQTDNHTNTSLLSFYRPDALPATQPTVSKHWRHISLTQQSVTNTPTALDALSWRFDLCGAANTQLQNFCSRGTSPVELSSSPAA